MADAAAVWYELLPYAELTPAIIALLRERDLTIYLAVTPDVVHNLADTVKRCRDGGLRVGVWPMVERENGRWPSADNVDRFEAFVAEVRRALEEEPDELILDFEPPIEALPALLAFDWRTIGSFLARGISRGAAERYRALAQSLHDANVSTLSAALPLVLSDEHDGGWQQFFGTPLDVTPTSYVSAMLYSSIMEGLTGGALDRRDTLSVLGAGALATKRRYGARASVSLGAIDVGALGDEPTYRTVDELREDVAVTRAAGIEHIGLFSLCGAMRRPPIERWLDVLVHTPATTVPALTPRARALVSAVWAVSRLMRLTARRV